MRTSVSDASTPSHSIGPGGPGSPSSPSSPRTPGTPRIPTVDLRPWVSGDPDAREEHRAHRRRTRSRPPASSSSPATASIPPSARTSARPPAPSSALPAEVKQPYAVKVGGRGWLGPGAEANGYSEGTETPPDLKESLSFATHEPFDDPEINAEWYAPNVWPAEAPELRKLCEEYLARMGELENHLLELLGEALGLGAGLLHPPHGPPDLRLQHQLVPGYGGHRRARGGPVPHRPAHRLRHGHHPRPAGRQGRAAGLHGRGRLGGRALRPGGVHHQHR